MFLIFLLFFSWQRCFERIRLLHIVLWRTILWILIRILTTVFWALTDVNIDRDGRVLRLLLLLTSRALVLNNHRWTLLISHLGATCLESILLCGGWRHLVLWVESLRCWKHSNYRLRHLLWRVALAATRTRRRWCRRSEQILSDSRQEASQAFFGDWFLNGLTSVFADVCTCFGIRLGKLVWIRSLRARLLVFWVLNANSFDMELLICHKCTRNDAREKEIVSHLWISLDLILLNVWDQNY